MKSSIIPWTSEYEDLLRDESRCIGTATSVSFPESETEVIEVLHEIRSLGLTVTTQGARTGIVGGAVPQGGHVMNLSRMKAVGEILRDELTDESSLTTLPGALLMEIREIAEKRQLFFPPDPTETSCSIGGMVACNASGALTFHYGPTRNWVRRLKIVLSDGDIIQLSRGESYAQGRSFSLRTEGGRIIEGRLPSYTMPQVKSAAGYYVTDNMDMLDLFIGMEGTLGIVTEIELRLIPKPSAVHGLVVFLPSQEAALKLVRYLRGEPVDGLVPLPSRPTGIEFFDNKALDLLRKIRAEYPAFEKIPVLKPHFHTAIYTEFHGDSDEALEEAVVQGMEAVEVLGGNDEDTWYATTQRELEPLKAFRHAVPEAVNLVIDERRRSVPKLTKLGTDMSVPNEYLETAIAMYEEGVRENDLESVVFGHIGNNHVHVNILPNSLEEYERGRSLYLSWARQVVDWKGSVSAEHGIGKLKTSLLEIMYGQESIAEMRALKKLFDPGMILNPGTLFL